MEFGTATIKKLICLNHHFGKVVSSNYTALHPIAEILREHYIQCSIQFSYLPLHQDISKNDDIWKTTCDEILRTATSSTRLRPSFQRLRDLLKNHADGKTSIQLSRIRSLCAEFQECRQGMRYQEIKDVEHMCLKLLHEKTADIITFDPETVVEEKITTRDIEALLAGLQTFKTSPNVLTQISELKKWLNEQSKYMAWSDLVDFSVACLQTDRCDLDQLAELMQRCAALQVPKDKFADVFYVAGILLTALRAFITEVHHH